MTRGLHPEVLILARAFHPVKMDAHHLPPAIADFERVSVQRLDHRPVPRLRADTDKNKDRDRYDDGYYNNNGYNNGYGNNGYGNNNYGNPRQTFTCESRGGNFTYCNQNAYGHVEIYKQLSSAQCNYGQSWGTERNRVWVSNGCRAEFAVY